MSPKLGQKIKDNPKDKRIEIRMDDETVRKLDILANEQNVSRAKVIRQGIEMQYKNRQKYGCNNSYSHISLIVIYCIHCTKDVVCKRRIFAQIF